jgi:hypothetical protein
MNPFFRKILMHAFSDITVAALEVAPVCDLKLEITERRDRRGVQ